MILLRKALTRLIDEAENLHQVFNSDYENYYKLLENVLTEQEVFELFVKLNKWKDAVNQVIFNLTIPENQQEGRHYEKV